MAGTAGTPDTSADGSSSGEGTAGAEGETDPTGAMQECGAPVELGLFQPTDGEARGFAVRDDVVYLAVESEGLEVVDIGDPASPTSLGVLDFALGELAFSVAVDGDHAFVGKRGAGWSVVDVTDPGAMVEVAFDDADDAEDVAVVDGTLFVLDTTGLRTYDVVDPTVPVVMSPTVTLPGSCRSMVVAGSTAYIASTGVEGGGGLVMVDVSDPSSPTEIGVYLTTSNAAHLEVDGNTAYVSHLDGVDVVDVTDPAMPVGRGVFVQDRSHAVASAGSRLFVLGDDTSNFTPPTLTVVDVSNPEAPTVSDASFDAFADPYALEYAADMLMLTAEDDDALHILDPCPTP